MASNTIVVLGANAFSGQDFIDLLLDNPAHTVIGISRKQERASFFQKYRERKDISRFKFYALDMNTQIDQICALLDQEKPSKIVNFAAQSEVAPSWEHPEHWYQTNTVALAKLVNHLRKQSYLERYLHISSPEAYGSCSGVVTESTPDNPSTPYASSKSAADQLLSVFRKQFNFPVMFIRATNVYGARQQLFKIIPRSAIYLKSGKIIELHGGGVAVKSYIHIRDVSAGELAVLERGKLGERYHISPDAGVSVRKVVELMCERFKIPFEQATKIVAERPGQDAAYVIDSTKIRTELGWKPIISLEQGLSEVVSWVDAYWPQIQNESLAYLHSA